MENHPQFIYDVLIVGGGPAGLSAALVLARACRRVAVIDSGEPRNAAAKQINGFLGRDGTNPHDLRRDGRRDVARYDIEIIDDVVTGCGCPENSQEKAYRTTFEATTRQGRRLVGRKILFATGARDKLPELPGLRECYGLSVHHCPYCDGWEHRQQRILAYGATAEQAAGMGLAVRGWSEHVTVVTHGAPLDDKNKRRLKENGIAYREQRIVRLVHSSGKLQAAELEGVDGLLPADALFFHSTPHPPNDLPRSLGCELGENDVAQTSRKQTTNVPGVFLAGDADGDVQLAIVAAAEGATAAVAINRELQDEDRASAEH
jgi:thioredoxin reductase